MAGAVVSTSMFEIPSEFEFPALSVTDPETNWFSPSPSVTDDGQGSARPEVASEQEKLTVGAPVEALYQPLAAGDTGAMLAVMVGEIVSTSISERAAEFEFPALSVTEPETDWFSPSPSATAAGQGSARPEVASEQAKLTVGAPVEALYQPLAAGEAGAMFAVIVGAVMSTSISETPSEFELPALSVTVSLTDWFSPSPRVIDEGHGPDRPEVSSEQVKLTVGAPVEALYHPLAAGEAGAMLAVIARAAGVNVDV